MDKKIEHEIISILDEQIALGNIEALAGNEVKREFHRGAVFGIKLILDTIYASQPRVEDGRADSDDFGTMLEEDRNTIMETMGTVYKPPAP